MIRWEWVLAIARQRIIRIIRMWWASQRNSGLQRPASSELQVGIGVSYEDEEVLCLDPSAGCLLPHWLFH
jgi:hypothetical protein